jgi:hypothetical protein
MNVFICPLIFKMERRAKNTLAGPFPSCDRIITMKINPFLIKNSIPVVTGVEPNQGIQNSIVILLICGHYFRPEARVLLCKGQFRIGATRGAVLSDTQVKCEVNLRGAEAGVYDLKIVNDDGQFGILAHSFTVADSRINQI